MKLLTVARDLQRRRGRERRRLFVAEGLRSVESLLSSRLQISGIVVSESGIQNEKAEALADLAGLKGVQTLVVSDEDFSSAAGTESPQGILAIAQIPDSRLPEPLPSPSRLLILDAIQDPGNVGTAIRSAAALGVAATIALPGTADPWSAKTVRSAMGALFGHPVISLSWDVCRSMLEANGFMAFAADMHGLPPEELFATSAPDRIALIVGNEGAGISQAISGSVGGILSVRMSPGVESLNVGVATGILLHALRAAQEAEDRA